METISTAVSIAFSVLFIASTVVNIFVSLRLTKLENEIKESFRDEIKISKKELREYTDKEVDSLRKEIQREMEIREKRYGNGNK